VLNRGPARPHAAFALAFALHALAPVGPASAEESRLIRVGVYSNLPKIGLDHDGRPAGLFIELIERIAADNGWQPAFQPCEWGECLRRLADGELDLMPDVALTADRRARFHFHDIPVVQSWSQFYAPPARPLTGFDDLRGLRIAVLEASVQQAFLERMRASGESAFSLVVTDSLASAFAQVRDGQADAAVANNFFGQANAARFELVETPITFNQVSLFYAASDAGRAYLPAIDAQLGAWKSSADSPYYDALVRAFGTPAESRLPDWALSAVIVAVAAALLMAAVAALQRWRVRRAAARLDVAHGQLAQLLDSAPTVLYSLSYPGLDVEWVSPNVRRIMGFTQEEALRPGWWARVVHPDDRAAIDADNARLGRHASLAHEYRILDAGGRVRYVRDEKRLVRDEPAGGERVVGTWNDLTSTHEHAQEIDFLSNFDQLTRLPNRQLLDRRLGEIIAATRESGEPCTVILLDIDRFKSINESLGLDSGDSILRRTADRLRRWTCGDDFVARFGNDEFVVVTARFAGDELECAINELQQVVNVPVMADGRELLVTASFGVARRGPEGSDGETLLRRAHQAALQARHAGGGRWRLFDAGAEPDSDQRLFLESDLRRAVDGREMVLHFQPQRRMADSSIAGVEALVRWNHPEHGLLAPDRFIGLAEETGMIEGIDAWVLGEACRQLSDWLARGIEVPHISVNVSAQRLYDEELIEQVDACVQRYDLDPRRLMLELTETQLMRWPERAEAIIRRLGEIGVGISVDDFGTGYSNLAYLNRLALNQIKLDRSLILDIESSSRSWTMVRGMINISRELGLETVAEGIETERHWALLREAGCGAGQGFLIARPMPAGDLQRWLGR
jgi:diguanylate cyclase (GGDEF)-like protein/PAS domain S-box-containing protein